MTEDDRASASEGQASGLRTTTLSLDTIFELLANQHRRYALYTIVDGSDNVVDFEAVVEDVATLEAGIAGTAVTADRYRSIATDLYHWHLPVLTDVGVVDYDDRSGTIRYHEKAKLETWLSRAHRDEFDSR